jgi:hypothetical protein
MAPGVAGVPYALMISFCVWLWLMADGTMRAIVVTGPIPVDLRNMYDTVGHQYNLKGVVSYFFLP